MHEPTPSHSPAADPHETRMLVGGPELFPQLPPLWEALFDHHHANGNAGIPSRSREDSTPLRLARYRRILSEHGGFVVLALAGERPVGYALAYHHDPIAAAGPGPVVMIESLSLLPETRGHGLGPCLIAEAEGVAAERWGATVTALEVMTGNESAARFYARAGFVAHGETWLRLGLGTAPGTALQASSVAVDRPRLERLAAEPHADFEVGLEEGPDDTWLTSDVMVACTPRGAGGAAPSTATADTESSATTAPVISSPASAAALEATLLPFAAAGATSSLVVLNEGADPAWSALLTEHGFGQAFRLLTRPLVSV